MKKIGSVIFFLVISMILSLFPAGCGGAGSGSRTMLNFDEGGSVIPTPAPPTGTLTLAGRLTATDLVTPVSGATVTLNVWQRGSRETLTTATDGNGYYSFSDLYAGDYIVRFFKDGYVPTNIPFSLAGNIVDMNAVIVGYAAWNQFMGDTAHPYNPQVGYFLVQAQEMPQDPTLFWGAPLSTVVMSINPSAGILTGYVDDNFAKILWPPQATSTSKSGMGFFLEVPVGATYTISGQKSAYTFQDITGAAPIAGEVVVYALMGTGAPLSDEIVFASDRNHFGESYNNDIFIMNGDGTAQTCLTAGSIYDNDWPDLSPDGKRIVYDSQESSYKSIGLKGPFPGFTDMIKVMNADGTGTYTMPSDSTTEKWMPRWSPDGKKIAFLECLGDGEVSIWTKLWIVNSDGSNPQVLVDSSTSGIPWTEIMTFDWSPDSAKIAYCEFVIDGESDAAELWVVNASGAPAPQKLPVTGYVSNPKFSPGGTMIAYERSEIYSSIGSDLWIVNTDGSNQVQITNSAEAEEYFPQWASDESRLLYAEVDSTSSRGSLQVKSPDQKKIRSMYDGQNHLCSITLDASRVRTVLHDFRYDPESYFDNEYVQNLMISRNGMYLIFDLWDGDNASGRAYFHIYRNNFDQSGYQNLTPGLFDNILTGSWPKL